MNEKQFHTFLGALFIIGSGIIYELEKISTYVKWQGQITTGSFPTNPNISFLTQSLFPPLFFIVGIIFIVLAIKNKRKS